MATTIAIRFPLGRYHATPWDRSANEGATEWPPSPWRILRALVATWYTRWPDLPAPELDALLEALGDPPSYRTPQSASGHSRHYLPDLDHTTGETGGTALTLDAFLSVPKSAELLVCWGTDLPAAQRKVLAKLAELLPYVGRADSVCEARLLDVSDVPDETWWRPGTTGSRQARLLAAARPVSRPALEVSTVQVRRSRRMRPLGSEFVPYSTDERPLVQRLPRLETPSVEALRFAVTGSAPMLSANGVLLADEAHSLAGGLLESRMIDDVRRRLLLGTDGAASGHQHAHWIPIADSDRRGAAVRSLVLWVPSRLRPSEVATIIGLRTMSGKRGHRAGRESYEVPGFPEVRLLFQAAGTIDQVAPELTGSALRWRSLTPYLPVRHRKAEPASDYLTSDITAELGYRDQFKDLAPPVVTATEPDWQLPDRWSREFRRYRMRERLNSSRPGLGLRLEFAEAISGPLLLGQLSHFGYGIFVPEPT